MLLDSRNFSAMRLRARERQHFQRSTRIAKPHLLDHVVFQADDNRQSMLSFGMQVAFDWIGSGRSDAKSNEMPLAADGRSRQCSQQSRKRGQSHNETRTYSRS